MMDLHLKSFFIKAKTTFESCIQRNKMIIKATTFAFFAVILLSIFLVVLAFSAVPWLGSCFLCGSVAVRLVQICGGVRKKLHSYSTSIH